MQVNVFLVAPRSATTELKRMAHERAQTEARLRKMGISIDEDYQDPPIKALE
ncbi:MULTISPECIES: hypothetical protein [Pseudomonas]|uniref:hypothetical protein n=1 Tax=Pseudomonas TaxID=286 RepID=UPI0015B5BE20|nr:MULTISPECIES: hypothetical protein [Pseudomonas]MBI6927230.1 hypothetical protein [Pseudomonas putida]